MEDSQPVLDYKNKVLDPKSTVLDHKSKIYTYEEVANLITNLTKPQFVVFVKHILDFSNVREM